MTITKYTLSDTQLDEGGNAVAGATVYVQLCDKRGLVTDGYRTPITDHFTDGTVASIGEAATADSNGAWSVDIPTNLDGIKDRRYLVQVYHPTTNAELVREIIQMPDRNVGLYEVADSTAVDPTPQTEAAKQADYAEEWAQNPEDTPVSTAAGGDGSTDRSSLHWSEKSREWAETPYNTDVPAGSPGDRSALHYQATAKDWATTEADVPSASGGDGTLLGAKGYSLLAKDWAQKLGSAVAAGLYSAREWAIGSATRGTAGGGSSKDWATLKGQAVDGAEYAAAEYATGGLSAHGGSAKSWAQKVGSAVVTGLYSAREWAIGTVTRGTADGGSARDWATLKGQTVDDTEHAAAEYATGDLEGHGGSAKAWAQDASSPDGSTSKSSKGWAGVSEAWAEGTEPGGPGTKASKTWAAESEQSALDAEASTQRVDLLGALEFALDQVGQTVRESLRQGAAIDGQVEDLYLVLAAIEQALDLSGQTARQVNGGRVSLRGGSLADPALTIGTAKVYSSAADTLSIGIGDSEVARFTSAGLTVYGTVTEV